MWDAQGLQVSPLVSVYAAELQDVYWCTIMYGEISWMLVECSSSLCRDVYFTAGFI